MRTNKPSATAVLIAASLACDYHDWNRRSLVPALAAELGPAFLESYGPPANFFASLITRPWLRAIARAVEIFTIPGITLHYVLRKRYIEDTVRENLKTGINQVVVLGGGFDTLAVRLHREFPCVKFFELDHPNTQQAKLSALKQIQCGENITFVPSDFTNQTLEDVLLNQSSYDANKNSLFLCEGVLMYLPETEINKIFGFIREHSGRKSVFLFTFMEKLAGKPINFHNRSLLVDMWMKLRREPFVWGIERNKLNAFVEPLGFSVVSVGDARVFRERYLFKKAALAEGESVVNVCRTG